MPRSLSFRPAVATLVALSTMVAYTGLSVPVRDAQAVQDDVPTLDVISGLNATLDLFGSMAGVGALGQQLPALALTPGSEAAIGLADLLTAARDAKAGGATWGGVNSLEDLVDQIDDVGSAALPVADDIGDGRRVDLTAERTTAGDVHTITVGFVAERPVDTGLDIVSTSPKFSFTAAEGIEATVSLEGSFTMVYDESEAYFRLLKTASTPSLDLSVSTAIPDLSAVSAGIGILGVGLKPGSTYVLSASLSASFDDPDGDGTLAFTEPGGPGELSAPGVGAGITEVALTSGTLASTLHLTALSSPYVNLGAADVSVSVTSADLLTTAPVVAVTAGSLAGLEGFQRLSPRDLSQGLAELATTVVALQQAGGADLPFLRGSIGDAVQATEGLVEFLAEHVQPSDDPLIPGRPDFASVQELFTTLVAENGLASGVDFGIGGGSYDGSKLRFDLSLTRAAGPAEPLNALGQATSGDGVGTTYTATTLFDPDNDFSDGTGEAASYVGRQVLAGAGSAIIASASGNTLTLDPAAIGNTPAQGAWQGGTPANGTPYSISAGDPRTGLVELGNVLESAGAITNANAKTAVAEVRPSYTLTLPVALDLRPGSTSDCDPGPGTGCPFQLTENGITTIITELPLPADRILLGTGQDLLTADAPITTDVTVDATVGFVGVKVTGELRACTTQASVDCTGSPAAGTHLLELGLVEFGDSDGEATLPEVGKRLTAALTAGDLSTVLTGDVNGQAWASLTIDVPGTASFFGGTPATAVVTLDDITDPGDVDVVAPDLATLLPLDFDPDNPLALFGILLADLQGLQDTLDDLPGGAAALDTQIPLVGRSLSDLIGSGVSGGGSTVTYGPASMTDTSRSFDLSYLGRRVTSGTTSAVVLNASGSTLTLSPWNAEPTDGSPYEIDSELQGVVNLLTAAPPASLQDALALLKNGLGIDTGPGEALGFTVDTTGPDPVLRLDVDWVRSVEKTLPINLSFDLGTSEKALIGAESGGALETTVSGGISLGLEMPLTIAAAEAPLTNLRIDPDSSIDASATLVGDGLRLATNIGPFQLSLGNPDTGQPAGTELEARFGVSLTDGDVTHTDPVSLSDFADALELTMDNGVATCAGAPSTAELSACAVLPVYFNGTLVSPTDNAFVLRLPRSATDLADAFDLSGADIEAGVPRFAYPPDLAAKLATAGLNMLTVGDGLFAYIEFLENALDVASAGGKLPLIGKDLQAGSAFLEDLRTGLQNAFGGAPENPTAGDIATFLDTQVAPVLGVPAPLPIQFECEVYLETPAAPTAAATNAGVVDTDYFYKVVATVNAPSVDGLPSAASTVVSNSATLDATHYNDVSWTAVEHATGYKVLRRAEGESDYSLVGDVTAPTVTFKDDESASTPYAAVAANPQVVPCPASAPADSVTGFSVAVDIGQGNPTAANGCTTDCLESSVPLDLGIPGLSFKASDVDNDKVVATLGWSLHLEFGLDREDGFFVRTQDETTPEFIVGAALDLPADMQAQLAFFDIDIAKHAGAAPKMFHGAFAIDLKDEAGAPDCHLPCASTDDSRKLTFASLKGSSLGDLVDPRLDAGVDIDWDVKATVDSALPGVAARFMLEWDWSSTEPGDFTNLTTLAFKDVVIDPGAFISGNIGPIINQIISVFKPVQPIIDTILAPLPVLSDLSKLAGGDDVTIASLAQTFSTLAGGPDIGPFIEVIKVIKSLSGLIGDCGGPSFCVQVGDFDIKKELAMGTANSAATAANLVGAKAIPPGDNPFQQLSEKSGDKLGDAAAAAPALADAACPNGKRGISFPALENPTSLFGLLLNQDVEIACFDSGPLTLGFEMNLRLGPVYAPPPVYIVISGGASVSLRIAAGFDTYGIRTAVESGKLTAGILDSIYFKTTDITGAPLPVVKFTGFLAAGASVSAVIIEVGVVGGIELTVAFTWNDPNNDGKFRFNEFLATALNNPICLFNVGGQLELFIKVFVTLGISPFSVSFDFELVRIKLLDFSLKPNCEPPPPRLGGTKGSTLYLFAGKYSSDAERGAPWGSGNTADEGWVIRQVPDDTSTSEDERAIVVQAIGITETFPDAGGTSITAVVLDGRGYAGKLKVVFNGGAKGQPFDKSTYVFGGNGSDTIRTGSGNSYVDAGPGDDNVSTTDRPDLSVPVGSSGKAVVAGGTGKDGVTVGNGDDFAHGDGALAFSTANVADVDPLTGGNVTLNGVIDISTVAAPSDASAGTESGSDGPDIVSAGIGGADLWGGGGADTIGTASDSPLALLPANAATVQQYVAQKNVIVGGGGSDRIKSGSAADDVYTGAKADPGQDGAGSGDAASDVNTVDTGTGSDTVFGSNGKDNVTTGSSAAQTAKVYGAGENDILAGGDGTDELYGGPGDDYVIAEPSTVDTVNLVPDVLGSAYTVTRVNRPSSNSTKLLAGGGGSDRLYGGNGTARIYGDRQDFTCAPGAPVRSDPPVEAPTVSEPADPAVDDADDLILGGDGVDTVNAGGGDDHVHAKGGDDLLCGNAGDDHVYAGAGLDDVWGGSGDDTAYGDTGSDDVFGNGGTDSLYGGGAADVLEGNGGSDHGFGGADADVVVGGTRKDGRHDSGDTLYGDDGADVLIGDNGIPGTLYDLASTDPALGGEDVIWGGAQDDDAFGGLEDDEVHGGDGADQLEGNPASDEVFGDAGADNIIGGSSQLDPSSTYPDSGDVLRGGTADDVVAGDNASITDTAGAGTAITKGRGLTVERAILLYDLGLPPADPGDLATFLTKSGADTLHGEDGTDVLLGQGVNDGVYGGDGDDYAEGGQANDTVEGGADQDDLVGGGHSVRGSGTGQDRAGQPDIGDTVRGGDDQDAVIGDNGQILRGTTAKSAVTTNRGGMTERLVEIYDLGDGPHAAVAGADWLLGEAAADVILGQSEDDRITGGAAQDYAEGGPGADWVEGNDGRDDLVGGSSTPKGADTGRTTVGQLDGADVVWGGPDDDLVLGDNAVVSRTGDMHELTYRIGSNPAGAITDRRSLQLLDLEPTAGDTLAVPTGRFGADRLSGQGGVDVLLGQDGDDLISGGSADDYVEGHGGADVITGDALLSTPTPDTWPATHTVDVATDDGADGQDDLIGGKSEAGYRDAGDTVSGNGAADFVLGDNGSAVRDAVDLADNGFLTDRLYLLRYPAVPPAGAAKLRHRDSSFPSTRFCDATLTQCERPLAWGGDELSGDAGDDVLYGQDGHDTIRGGTEDDDVYGELGNDTLFGDAGDDAILGDRGGVRDRYEDGGRDFGLSVTQVPKVSFDGFVVGSVTRETDLLHDVDADAQAPVTADPNDVVVFVGGSLDPPMPHDGITKGGADRIRGGTGHDSIHAGAANDLANGDSGGDTVFGDNGADVLWGGKGCDKQVDTIATAPYCYPGGVFDPAPHRADGSTVPAVTDYLFGGIGGVSSAPGDVVADLLDWRPRGTYYAGPSKCTTNQWPVDLKPGGKKAAVITVDPCSWFEMTELDDDVAEPTTVTHPDPVAFAAAKLAYDTSIADNQHHAGIDWQYGGWDRDVLQGDVADNGPNEGDRLLDWNGTFNLYTHCNSAYGGYNDVRQHSPTWQDFLQRMAWALGAGQDDDNPVNTRTPRTSAYVELALVYPGEKAAGSGSAFPETPGHFANPNACGV